MQRREFVASSLAVAAAAAALPKAAQAAQGSGPMKNVVFTEEDPGHWKDVEKLHVPLVKIEGRKMTVTTPHPMSEAHYIVSHTVVLEGGEFLDRKTFDWKDQPTSEHRLPEGYKGKVTVTSTCNRHDWWLKTIGA